MKKKSLKVLAAALTAVCVLSVPTMQVEAGLLTKVVEAKKDKVVNVVESIDETKKELRKDFMRLIGSTDEDIEKLEALDFFNMELIDFVLADDNKIKEISIIFKNNNSIDFSLYFNFITINDKNNKQ